MKIGIVVITYNRLNSLKRVLNSLQDAYYCGDVVDLNISIDKSDTEDLIQYAQKFDWIFGNLNVISHEENMGLRKHVLSCGKLLEKYDGLVVLEDDMTVSPNFYIYAKKCIEFYCNDDKIAGISLYNFPLNYQTGLPFTPMKSSSDVYFMQVAQSWGQVWMPRQWNQFIKWYEEHCNDVFPLDDILPNQICNWKESSWLKYHMRYCIENGKYFVYPYYSLSTNNSDVGTHNDSVITFYQSQLSFFRQSYNLVSLSDSDVRYDGFFENEKLGTYLNIPNKELTVDLYGNKNKIHQKRYLLTRKIENYKILKSFALAYKPYELNIIYDRVGNELFLYDTAVVEKNMISSSNLKIQFFKYLYSNATVMFPTIMGGKSGVVKFLVQRIVRLIWVFLIISL